jgi:hypothetical protein
MRKLLNWIKRQLFCFPFFFVSSVARIRVCFLPFEFPRSSGTTNQRISLETVPTQKQLPIPDQAKAGSGRDPDASLPGKAGPPVRNLFLLDSPGIPLL